MVIRLLGARLNNLAIPAAFVGVIALIGTAAAESTLGDQSFQRGGDSAVRGQPVQVGTDEGKAGSDWMAKLPEGVEIQLVTEYSSDIPGIQKVQLRKVTLEPGAILANFTVTKPLYCDAAAGTISVFDHAKRTTAVYRPGDHWSFARGEFTLSNPGDVDHVHYLYALIQGQEAAALRGKGNWEPSGLRGTRYIGKI
ncbi:MAG: hypothetical protein L0387_34985 [Acidobacteria bacterium]|nr:hypothetical protein [Acidobacteriota bacterium]